MKLTLDVPESDLATVQGARNLDNAYVEVKVPLAWEDVARKLAQAGERRASAHRGMSMTAAARRLDAAWRQIHEIWTEEASPMGMPLQMAAHLVGTERAAFYHGLARARNLPSKPNDDDLAVEAGSDGLITVKNHAENEVEIRSAWEDVARKLVQAGRRRSDSVGTADAVRDAWCEILEIWTKEAAPLGMTQRTAAQLVGVARQLFSLRLKNVKES